MLCRALIALLSLAAMATAQRGVPSDWQAAMNRIRAESIRGHLSFLASDLLEGRATPSRGLDVAAEYIAAQFRRAGLEASSAGGYYQPLELQEAAPDLDGFQCRLFQNGEETHVSGIPFSIDAIDVDREPLLPATTAQVGAKGAVVVFRGDTLYSDLR